MTQLASDLDDLVTLAALLSHPVDTTISSGDAGVWWLHLHAVTPHMVLGVVVWRAGNL